MHLLPLQHIAQMIAIGRTVALANGHAPFYEEWQAFNRALATFLEESFLPPPAATRSEQP